MRCTTAQDQEIAAISATAPPLQPLQILDILSVSSRVYYICNTALATPKANEIEGRHIAHLRELPGKTQKEVGSFQAGHRYSTTTLKKRREK